MKAERSCVAGGLKSAALASLIAALLASCASSTDSQLDLSAPSLAPSGTAALSAVDGEAGDAAAEAQNASAEQVGYAEAAALPKSVGVSPRAKPAEAAAVQETVAAAKTEPSAAAPTLTASPEPVPAKQPSADAAPAARLAAATPADLVDKNKRSFLSSFFGSSRDGESVAASAPKPLIPEALPAATQEPRKPKALIKLASADPDAIKTARTSLSYDGGDALPGVRQTMLFEIRRRSGVDDDSDVDVHEEDDLGPITVASAAGMARLAPNGLLKQNESVDTACLKPGLVRVLKLAEQHFGKKAVITSGYRSPAYNKRVNGAKHSYHMACAAADVQMAGVGKFELASFFRAMPGRGGVGTYCHTTSVHVDIGPERDWNWRCGRRS